MEDIWIIILSIGMAQGLFLIISLLLIKEKKRLSVNLLLFLLLCVFTLLFSEWLYIIYPIEKIVFTYRTIETIPLLIGPLFWIYTISIIKNNFEFKKKHVLHFVPFIIFFFLFLPFYIKSSEFKLQYINERQHNPIPLTLALFSWFKGLHTAIYLIMSWYFIKKFQNPDKKKVKRRYNVNLLYKLIIFQLFVIFCIYFIFTLEYFNISLSIETDRMASILITFSFFVYAFAIVMFPQTVIPEDLSKFEKNKYLTSSLEIVHKQKITESLKIIMEREKPYLYHNLTLDQLSSMINISSNKLSQVINEILNKNFNQLINEYRIDEVKHHIHNNRKTLYGIALDSGFNSKSAFNRTFKEVTGMTPSQYKKTFKN